MTRSYLVKKNSFLLGPRDPGEFLSPGLDLSDLEPVFRSPDQYRLDPRSIFVNDFYEVHSSDLDTDGSSVAIRQLNATVTKALEAKELLVAASSLADAIRDSSYDPHSFGSAYTFHPCDPEDNIPPYPAITVTSTAYDDTTDLYPIQEGSFHTNLLFPSQLLTFINGLLSIRDFSKYIEAFSLFISDISDTLGQLHEYTLNLIIEPTLLLPRIGRSVEGFISFTTWPRPPTSVSATYRSLSA